MYLTYEQYQEYGGTLDETTFNQLEFEAEAEIDWRTFNRLHKIDEENLDEKVHRCAYNLIDLLYTIKTFMNPVNSDSSESQSPGISKIDSQSNDGVSTSYNILSARELMDRSKDEIENCINKYLQGVTDALGRKVLYRGIYPNE